MYAIGDRVIVMEGSSEGHTGIVVRINNKTSIRIKREADGIEVDVPMTYVVSTRTGKIDG